MQSWRPLPATTLSGPPLRCTGAAEATAGEGLESTMRRPSPALRSTIQFLRHAPGMSYVTALQLVCHFNGRCLSDIVRCSESDLDSALAVA